MDMDKIRKYMERFFKSRRKNSNYDMGAIEWAALVNSEQNRYDVIGTTFNFGYAKGYRAAMAEMKKGKGGGKKNL